MTPHTAWNDEVLPHLILPCSACHGVEYLRPAQNHLVYSSIDTPWWFGLGQEYSTTMTCTTTHGTCIVVLSECVLMTWDTLTGSMGQRDTLMCTTSSLVPVPQSIQSPVATVIHGMRSPESTGDIAQMCTGGTHLVRSCHTHTGAMNTRSLWHGNPVRCSPSSTHLGCP